MVKATDVPQPSKTPSLVQMDIGIIYSKATSPADFSAAVHSLTVAEKYELLTNHKIPHKDHAFPTQHVGGCNRSFKPAWLSLHPWMVYSEQVDGVFCIICAIFCTDLSKGSFVNKPFHAWNKKSEKAKEHENSLYHQKCMELADSFKYNVEHPDVSITSQVDARKAANIERNRSILKSLASAVLFCGKQCIALRGDAEKPETPGNPGNFLALLKLLATNDDILRKHLETPAMRNATYISPQSQNDLIEVIGEQIFQGIVDDVNASPFYAILADEVTSHNVEYLALCVRFFDHKQNTIREEFLAFLPLVRITGEAISAVILGFLSKNQIPASNMRGQGYDGASNMASDSVGVQARIKQAAPLATYVHCNGHCLNLVISKSCKLPQVRNVLDRMQSCSKFFLYSPKRMGVLELIIRQNVVDETRRKPLLDVCRTRWAERQSAYQHFYQAYVFITEALELIGYKRHMEKYGTTYSDWGTTSRSDAQQLLAGIISFEFIVVFLTTYQYLSHLAGITVKLQKRTLDIIEAHEEITEITKTYSLERKNVDSGFAKIFEHSKRVAEKVDCTIQMPRIASRQKHRSNAAADNPCEYFQRNVAIPLLDHIISFLDQQFCDSSVTAIMLLGLVPSILCRKNINLETAVSKYSADLPSPELFQMELKRWKNRYTGKKTRERPSSAGEALKECDKDMFPNIFVLLQIACTIPVTSCKCERSASGLRRLNNFLRASMGKDRLSHLALMHIHYDTPIDLDSVVDTFATQHPRRLELDSLP